MADNFVTKEPVMTVTVSGEVADTQYLLFLVLKHSLPLTNLKKIYSKMKNLFYDY